jgi:hypothetical protein
VQFVLVADVGDVDIYAPRDSFISYFNSPYYAHSKATALDIYTWDHDYAVALSPVAGRVMKIYSFTPPTKWFLKHHNPEQLIILTSNGHKPYFIRLLHINSTVKVGDSISVGDELGTFIRSGFFNYWTDPHIHIDVRRYGNVLRAKGSLPITPRTENIHGAKNLNPFSFPRYDVTVVKVKREYVLVQTTNTLQISGVYGFAGRVDAAPILLDAGLPHYSYGGIHFTDCPPISSGDPIYIGSHIIGTITHVLPHYALFKTSPLHIYLNSQKIRGLSFYLYLNNQKLLKIIPLSPGTISLKKGDCARLYFKILPELIPSREG